MSFQKASLIITIGKRLNILTKQRNDYIEHWFTKKMRKEIENKVLNDIYMLNGDRVFVFNFDSHKLLISLYGKGNICLYKNDEKIACLTKDEIKSENHNLDHLLQAHKDKSIGAVLVRYVGKKYMKYILNEIKMDEKMPALLAADKIIKIEKIIDNMLEQFKPVFNKADNDYGLINENMGNNNWEKTDSLSMAMDLYYAEAEKKQDKLEKAIKIQEQNINDYEKRSIYYRKIAEWILKNAGVINELIYNIRDNKIREHEIQNIKINKKDKTVEIKIDSLDNK